MCAATPLGNTFAIFNPEIFSSLMYTSLKSDYSYDFEALPAINLAAVIFEALIRLK